MDLKIGEGRCEANLPWGFKDEEGVVHYKAIVREMTGREEEIFFSDKISAKTRMAKIAQSCIESIGDLEGDVLKKALQGLTPGDFVHVLLLMRIASFGPDYAFEVKCEECGKKFSADVDLGALAVFDASKIGGRNIREHNVELPSGNHMAKMRIVTVKEADSLDVPGGGKDKERMTRLLMSRMIELDGNKPTRDGLLNLPLRDRNSLRNWIRKVEVGVEDNIEAKCTNVSCETEFETVLDIGQMSFFFPEEG